MSAFNKFNKKRKGFSVTELIIVVAIIGILLAVAVPSILAYYRELRLVELDDSARTIFLAAQNRLSAMLIANKDSIPKGTDGSCDYTKSEDPSIKGETVDFSYLTSKDPQMGAIVLGGSIESELHENNYIVEYDATSGVVHAVWYWEGDFARFKNAYKENYKVEDTEKSNRINYPVGYYGGGKVDRAEVSQMPIPELTLTNAEELKLDIKIPSTGVTGASGHILVNVAINGTTIVDGAPLTEVSGVGSVVLDTLKYKTGTTDPFYAQKWDAGINSNGWTVGNKFKDWVTKASLGVQPGDDITVSVTVYMDGEVDGKILLPQTASVKTNSLFEKVDSNTAYIAYGRHLQNLHESGSGGLYCSGVKADITGAVQTKDINFWLSNPGNEIQSWLDTYDMNFHPISNVNITEYNGSHNGQRFEIRNINTDPSGNAGLFSFVMRDLTLNNITMVNPTILTDGNSSSAGALVASVQGSLTVVGCRVYNEYIDGDGKNPDSVKKLLNLADGSKLDTIKIEEDSSGKKYVPMLEGLPHIDAPGNNSFAGGFVGIVAGELSISNSFASVIVVSDKAVGGLVGTAGADTITISNSYSGSMLAGNHFISGLVGQVTNSNSVNISNSYAAGEIVNVFDDTGFIGAGLFYREDWSAGDNNVENCYAAVRYVNADGKPALADKVYGTVYGTFGNDTSNYYVKQGGVIYGYNSFIDPDAHIDCGIETSDLSDLQKMLDDHGFDDTNWNTGAVTNSLSDTHAYRLLDATKDLGKTEAYPYPMLKIGGEVVPQYGDWLEADDAQAAFVYFEKYVGGEYGFEGYTCVAGGTPELFDKKPLETHDPDDEFYAVSDGYGLLVQREDEATDSTPPTNVKVDGVEVMFDPTATDEVIRSVLTVKDGTDEIFYDLYIIKNKTATPDAYYLTASIGDVEYYFNPDFAREVIAPAGTTPAPTAPTAPQSRNPKSGDLDTTASGSANGVVIRTARQLANMSTYTNNATNTAAQKWSFIQTLNVDFMGYDMTDLAGKLTSVVTPATGTLGEYTTFSGTNPFVPAKLTTGGSYTGNEYNIRYLYLSNGGSSTDQGLFGVVDGGTLSGIRLLNVKSFAASGVNRSGALVGYLESGTVDNCGVYVENKYANTHYIDDNNTPTDPSDDKDVVVEDQHYYRLFAINTISNDAIVGGLIGQMDDGTVKNSFASVKVFAAGYAGGFAGKINGGTITDCYSGGKTLNGVYRGISEASGTDASNVGTGNGGYAGGFAGSISNARFEGINYSTCSVRGENGTLTQIGMFSGETTSVTFAAGSTTYATGSAFRNNTGATVNADGSKELYTPAYYSEIHDETDYLLVGNTAPYGSTGTTVEKTIPYDLAALDGQDFPFATHNKEHHGDWIQAAMFTYIEIYDDNTYGVYSAKAGSTSNEAIINTLQPDNVVKSDFYRILNLGDISGKRFEINDVEDTTGLRLDTTEYTSTFKDGKIEVEGKEYYVFELADIDPTTNTAPSQYYNKLEIGNNTYYYNPYFACEAFEATAGTSVSTTGQLPKPGAEGQGTSTSYSGVVIRSARQLVYMSKYTTGWKQDLTTNTIYEQAREWNYDQLLNIDYEIYANEYNGVGTNSGNGGSVTYTGGYTNGERQRPAILTTGSYNGHDKYIKNLYIGADKSDVTSDTQLGSGLFGSVSGSVSHVNLINVSVDGGSSFATGGLVGVLHTDGQVDTCGIYLEDDFDTNYNTLTVTGESANGVGGLIGQINGGIVSNSFAAVNVEGTAPANTSIPTNPVGGFVGQFQSGTVTNCYAGGYVGATSKTYDNDSVNVTGNNNVGGFAGSIYGSAVFAADSVNYSTASVGGGTSNGLFAGFVDSSFTYTDSTLYAVAKAFDATTGGNVIAARDEDYLSDPEDTGRTTGFTDYHYNRESDIFPYATNLTEHHGDWIDPVMGAYYDTVGGTTGYYANGKSIDGITAPVVGKQGDGGATDDGYAFLSTTDLGNLVIEINGVSYTLEEDTVSLTANGKTYIRRYKVPAEALNAVTQHYYTNVSVNGQFFTANFAFAGEIFDKKTDDSALDTVRAKDGMNYNDKGTAGGSVTYVEKTFTGRNYKGTFIRTARQLANLGVRSNDGTYVDGKLEYTEGAQTIQKLDHEQLLDIDFDSYMADKLPTVTVLEGSNASSNHMPITMMDGGYNGHEYIIKKLVPGMIEQATYKTDGSVSEVLVESGLFGRVTGGTLRGIRLVNTTVDGDANAYTEGGSSNGVNVLDARNLKGADLTTNPTYGIFTLQNRSGGTSTVGSEPLTWGTGEYVGDNCIKFGATSTTSNASIKFTVTGSSATVKVWWAIGNKDGQDRRVHIFGAETHDPTMTAADLAANTPYVTVFQLTKAGTYYLGSIKSANFIYRVEVYDPGDASITDDPTPYTTTSSGPAAGTTGTNFTGVDKSKFKVRFGTLAGAVNPADKVNIDNCGAYVEADSTYTTEDAAYNAYTVTNKGGKDTTGGLIGMATKGANVTNSFAAVKVKGVEYVGGFAGHLKNMTVKDSYAGGHTVNSHYDTTNYNVTAVNGAAGGFAGRLEEDGGELKMLGIVYTTASASGKNEGQFAGAVTNGWDGYIDGANIANIYGIGDTDSSSGKTVTDESDYLNNFVVTVKDTSRTIKAYPYDTMLQEKSYPYDTPATQTEHHGDWTVRVNFIYYEVYEGSTDTGANAPVPIDGFDGKLTDYTSPSDLTVGFYGVLNDGTPNGYTVNTLSTTGYVVDSGYMILTEDDDLTDLEFSINSRYKDTDHINRQSFTARDRITLADAMGSSSTTFTRAKYGFVISHDTVKIAPADHFYMPVTVNGQAYMINPHFACEVVNVGYLGNDNKADYDTVRIKPDMRYREIVYDNAGNIKTNTVVTEKIDGLIIRSPFNFASMARYTRYGNTSTYRDNARKLDYSMLMDVDYTKYIDNVIYDGYDSNRSDTGNKDANGNTLYNYHSGSGYAYGQVPATLVGSTFNGHGHTLRNLYLTNDSNYNFYVGIFSGLDNATVMNLKVDGLHMTTGTPAKDNGSGRDFTNDEKLIFIGGVASQVFNDSVVKNVGVSNVDIDLHRTPSYNKDDNKFEFASSTAPVRAVGGVVGALIDGTVENVTVDGIDIDLTGKEHNYTLPTGGQKLVEETNTDTVERPIVDDTKAVCVGGAIGEIDTTRTPMAAETVGTTGAIEKAVVSNVYVTGAEISASRGDGNIVGGLVGRADGKKDMETYSASGRGMIEIRNSGVYLTDAVVTDPADPTNITDNFNTKYGVTANEKSAEVGGFVGRADNYVSINSCFSAIRVKGAGNVGGFAGDIEGSSIKDSFSGGHTVNGVYATGTDAVANVTGLEANTVGGFAGKLENTDGSSLELLGTIYSTSSVTNTDATKSVGRFQGGESNVNAVNSAINANSATVYAVGKAVGKAVNVDAAYVVDETYLPSGAMLPGNDNDTTFVTKNYDPTLNGARYPYADGTLINTRGDNATPVPAHYGDWEEYAADGAFYWELEDSVYHFYTVLYDGETVSTKNDLCTVHHQDGSHAVTAWGYGVFTGKGTIALNGLTQADTTTDANAKGAMDKIMAEYASAKTVTMIAGATSKTDAGTATVTSSANSVFTINPSYAAAIREANETTPEMGEVGNAYQIRHTRQLSNIGDSNDNCFDQTHDIVFGSGDSYTSITAFKGDFNGGEYRIIDIPNPVFNELSDGAKVRNVVVYAPEGNKTINGKAGLAATSNGTGVTIENTVVAGFTINNGSSVGGLVGEVTGGNLTISNSEATNTLSGSANVGGLVGYVSAGKLNIARSYAGGSITRANSAGGLVGGAASSATVTYDNVYSYLDMTGVNKDNQKYGIGPQVKPSAKDTIGFWGGGVTNLETDDRKLRKPLLNLVDWSEDPTHATEAEHAYIPMTPAGDVDGFTDRQSLAATDPYYRVFPFKAYATNEESANVHYGDWPVAEKYAGLFYWEKEIVFDKDHPEPTGRTEYHFYAYGAEFIDGKAYESELIDSLCYSHHANERASIIDSGYGYFYDGDSMSFSAGTNNSLAEFTEVTDTTNPVRQALISAFNIDTSKYTQFEFYLMSNGDDVTTYKGQDTWTLGIDGSSSIGMKVFPMFGAAIYGDDFDMGEGNDDNIDEATPFVARTVRQFQNMANNTNSGLDYYALSHDIDFKYAEENGGTIQSNTDAKIYTPNASNTFYAAIFDGFGYRFVDFEYTATSGNASLFAFREVNNKTFRNIILYSPDGTATITSENGNAAGFIASSSRPIVFDNCVVSGYTIKGKGNIGGLIGETSSNNGNKIVNCQVFVTLDCSNGATAAGGLAGKFRGQGDNGGIFNSYSGGTIINATSSTKIGGIYGAKDSTPVVKDCYTYMDLKTETTGASAANSYPIGETSTGITGCYYFADNYTGSNGDQATAVNFGGLAALAKGSEADYSYWPKDDTDYCGFEANAMGMFPFRTVASYTEDGETIKIHYGQWPEGAQAAGVAYYEKDNKGEYHVQIVGVQSDGAGGYTEYTYDNLCDDRHVVDGNITMDHYIVESGYAAFTTKPGTMTVGTECELTGLGTATANSDLIDAVSLAIDNAFGGAIPEGGIKVYPTVDLVINEGNYKDYNMTPSVEVTAGGGTPVTVYYTNGFAGVSKGEIGVDGNAIKIRTVQQLDNIPYFSTGSGTTKIEHVNTKNKYFEQTHDLYGEMYTADGTKNGDPKYTGATSFSGTYDGGSYRILELSMEGTGTTDVRGVGLFNTAYGTIKNVILYSPSGNAHIKNETKGTSDNNLYGVGGIVGVSNDSGLTVSNCVVAGYTITGCDAVGGIVGDSYCGGTISGCAAVNKLVGTVGSDKARGMGGITGASDSDKAEYLLTITDCYAGGSITSADSTTHVGGIIGYDTYIAGLTSGTPSYYPKITDSYTYVDLSNTGADATNINTIGGNLTASGTYASTGNYYLDESSIYPTAGLGADNKQGVAMDYFTIVEKTTTDSANAAHAYDPTNNGLTNTTYPFPAVVKDKGDSDSLVHYGEMPPHTPVTQAINGIFYWEKHDGDYYVQYIGKDENGDPKNGSDLCDKRDGIGIEESGFGYFAMGSATPSTPNAGTTISDPDTVTGITEALIKTNGVFDKVNVTAFEAGATAGDQDWTVGPVSAHVDQGSAQVTSSAASTLEIRTYAQLALMNKAEKKNFKQTHDIDASASSSSAYTPLATLDTDYTYNGQGFRILELSITGSGSGNVGLFGTVKGTVEGVVLYSPSGDAEISNGANVGGIAGKIDGGTVNNCVVAGYTMTGTDYVGGIAGDLAGSGKITNCQAVNVFDANNTAPKTIGGIAGRAKNNIENCYAGGKVINVSGSKLSTYVGGIYGDDNNGAKPKNCYSYMDLSNVGSGITNYNGRLAAIGENYSGTDCYYLKSKFPTSVTTSGEELTASLSLTGFDKAGTSYAPVAPSMTGGVTGTGMTPMADDYPYPAVFEHNGQKEHYGTWLGTTTSSIPWGDFGIFLMYGSSPRADMYNGSSAVGIAFGTDSSGSLTVTRIGTNAGKSGNKEILPLVGLFIKNEHTGKISEIAAKVTVKFYKTGQSTPTYTLGYTNFDVTSSGSGTFANDKTDFNGYTLYTNTKNPNNQLTAGGTVGTIVVEYDGSEIGRFDWTKVDPGSTDLKSGDPGISEGPSFAPAILPKKFTLPDPDDQEEPGGDDHTEYVTLRTRPATVRRVSK